MGVTSVSVQEEGSGLFKGLTHCSDRPETQTICGGRIEGRAWLEEVDDWGMPMEHLSGLLPLPVTPSTSWLHGVSISLIHALLLLCCSAFP